MIFGSEVLTKGWGLLYPLGISIFISHLCIFLLIWQWKDKVDDWLSQKTSNRRWFRLFGSILVPLVAGGLIEVANFSDAFDGAVTISSRNAITALAPLVIIFFTAEYIMMEHEDNWQIRLESAEKREERERLLRDEAREYRDFLVMLDKVLRKSIQHRVEGLEKLCANTHKGKPISLPMVLQALAPNLQIAWLVHAICELFNHELTKQFPEKNYKARVALLKYNSETNCLEPVHSWDGHQKECIRLHQNTNMERFHLQKQTECLAGWVAARGIIRLASNAAEADADRDHPFHYFDPKQREMIKSAIVIPLQTRSSETPAKFVLCIDANVSFFFDDSKTDRFAALAEGLAQRLYHEDLLESLLKQIEIPPSTPKREI